MRTGVGRHVLRHVERAAKNHPDEPTCLIDRAVLDFELAEDTLRDLSDLERISSAEKSATQPQIDLSRELADILLNLRQIANKHGTVHQFDIDKAIAFIKDNLPDDWFRARLMARIY